VPPCVAFTLLTIIPVPHPRPATERDYGAATGWFPLVGYALGGLLALADAGLRVVGVSVGVTAWLLVGLLALLMGFLHLDGVIDTCDAAFSHRTPAERLVIARDPRAGAFGVVGVVVLLGLKAALFAGPLGPERWAAILVAPALARAAMTGVVVLFPTARGTEGFGAYVKRHASGRHLLLAALIALVPAAALLQWGAVAPVVGAVIGGGAVALFAARRLGGATGDVYGAACECAEVGALLGVALIG